MGSGPSGEYKGTEGSKSTENISLPENDSQLKHIFGDREGHLPDTPANRKLLTNLANDSDYYAGTDKYGNKWNVKEDSSGKQLWVSYRNSKISEGGRNDTPRIWYSETGLNNNPFKKKGK